jgi:hypothetical protein
MASLVLKMPVSLDGYVAPIDALGGDVIELRLRPRTGLSALRTACTLCYAFAAASLSARVTRVGRKPFIHGAGTALCCRQRQQT